MSNDLEYWFGQIHSFVFLVFLNFWHLGQMVGSDIHKHNSLKIHFNVFLFIREYFGEEAWDFIKKSLIVTCVFMYILEIKVLFGSDFVDEMKNAHWIDILEIFL